MQKAQKDFDLLTSNLANEQARFREEFENMAKLHEVQEGQVKLDVGRLKIYKVAYFARWQVQPQQPYQVSRLNVGDHVQWAPQNCEE
jgi:hypothetical protein